MKELCVKYGVLMASEIRGLLESSSIKDAAVEAMAVASTGRG